MAKTNLFIILSIISPLSPAAGKYQFNYLLINMVNFILRLSNYV